MDETRAGRRGDFGCFSFYDVGCWESVRNSIVMGVMAVVNDGCKIQRVYVHGEGSNGRVGEVVGLLRKDRELNGVEVVVGKPENFVSGKDYLIDVAGMMRG